MAASVSIASEYGKVQDLWRSIERDENWRLAIWETQVEDVDIVDKFMEVERSPAGEFSDVFFRFDASYQGNIGEFTKALWEEYVGWFDEKVPALWQLYEKTDDCCRNITLTVLRTVPQKAYGTNY